MGWALAGLSGWAALHEYSVVVTQASRDRSVVAKATARAAAVARTMQQAADNRRLVDLQTIASRAQAAYIVQSTLTASAARQLSAADMRLAQLTTASPAVAHVR